MVPISKSIWPLILFVYLNLHFILIIRFNLLCCFSKNILLGTVKSVPAKLCAAFLCTLLNRLRFSPQNVEFGTKRREIRPLRRGTPSVCSRWSASSPSPSRLTPCHLSQRERLWRNRTLCSSTGNYTAMPRALPLGELSPKVTERARTFSRRATVSAGNKRGSFRLPLRPLP